MFGRCSQAARALRTLVPRTTLAALPSWSACNAAPRSRVGVASSSMLSRWVSMVTPSTNNNGERIDLATIGDPELRTRVQPVALESFKNDKPALNATKARFRQALDYFEDVQSLAANQIGIPHRAIGYELTPEFVEHLGSDICEELSVQTKPFRVIFNPTFYPINKHQKMTITEGNVSVPFYGAYVERFVRIQVNGLNAGGREVSFIAEGHEASLIQQAVEMLDGILFTDKMEKETLMFAGDVTGAQEAEDRVVQEAIDQSNRGEYAEGHNPAT